MAKLKKYQDPYRKIRREIPPPGHAILHDKEYIRNRIKEIAEELVEEGIKEYLEGDDLIDDKQKQIKRNRKII